MSDTLTLPAKDGPPTVTLLHGRFEEIAPTLPDGYFDATVCDPPFGTTALAWDSVIPFDLMWGVLKRVNKTDAAIVLHCVDPFASMLNASNIKHFKQTLIWAKNNATDFFNAKKRHRACHENISLFSYGSPVYHPQKRQGKPFKGKVSKNVVSGVYAGRTPEIHYDNEDGMLYPTTVLEFDRETGQHPTQKPVPLMEYLIRTFTDPGDVVLDFTMGSGTTGVACVRAGRSFVGIEADDTHFDTAQRRIAEAQDVMALSLFGEDTSALFDRKHKTVSMFEEDEIPTLSLQELHAQKVSAETSS